MIHADHITLRWFIFLSCLGAEILTLMPVVFYLYTGWVVRRDKMLCYMNAAALATYYEQFPWTNTTEPDLAKRFRMQFNYLYGRRHFLSPLGLFAVVSTGALFGIDRSTETSLHVAGSQWTLPAVAVSALLGAFMWSIGDELGRVVKRDLSPKDVYGWVFRLFLSVPFGLALAAVLKNEVGVPVAFFVGAFPTQTLFRIARRIAVQKLGLGDQQGSTGLELQQLQSVSRAVAEAFQDEGVDTVSSLAWADPVDLTIRTNLDFNYVLDCMSQALLWVYFEEKTKLLFPYSLRGAQEVQALVTALKDVTIPYNSTESLNPEQARAKGTLTAIATLFNIPEPALMTTLRQVADDPYTVFIANVWH